MVYLNYRGNRHLRFMKKIFIYIFIIILIGISIFYSKYIEYKQTEIEINKFNSEYEKYMNKEILGTDLTSIINKAMDENEQAYVKKDENGKYIQNDENSINIEIKITDEDKEGKIYSMELLYNNGMNEFVKYYREINFKCTKVEYNFKQHIKYMLFEQISS